jgi:hypothetical protein
MEQKIKETLADKKPARVAPNKLVKKGTSKAYKITFFAIVGTLLWQSVSTSITNYQVSAQLEDTKRNQAIKIAEIDAARAQLQGVASKLAHLSHAGNSNAEEVITRFKKAGVDIRLNNDG